MKTVLIFVSTLDGKVTKWDNPHVNTWSSQTDQDYFRKKWKESKLIVMGSNSYNAEPVKLSPDQHLVVMTHQLSEFRKNKNLRQLEFTNESPEKLVGRFEKAGKKQMLIVGGAHIATSFFKNQLIDELWLTIEPKIFGTGGNFVIDEKLDINLQLLSCEKVNKQGTLITRYAVIKDKNITFTEK